MADLRPGRRGNPVLPARAHSRHERGRRGSRLGVRVAVPRRLRALGARGHARRRRRCNVFAGPLGKRRGARRGDGRTRLALRPAGRPEHHAQGLLRSRQPRTGGVGGPRLHRHLRRLAGGARRRDGRGDLARRHLHRPVPLVHEHGLAADCRRRRRPRQRGRRLRRARVHHGVRRRDRREGVALLHGSGRSGPWLRAPGDGGGRGHVGPGLGLGGRTRGHRLGRDGLRPRARPSLRGDGELLPLPDLAPKPVGGATTSTSSPSSRSTRRRAASPGTTRRCRARSGTTPRRRTSS